MDAETKDRDLLAECTEIGDLLMQSSMPILAANFNCLAQEIATALEAGDLAQASQAVDAAWQKAADEIRSVVTDNAPRVAELGGWPNYIPPESLAERVPINGETAAGFDAAIACARDHIPRDKQRLAAKLHAAYSQEAIQQVRDEALFLTPDSQTTYWLAASSICREGDHDARSFVKQDAECMKLARDPKARLAAAEREYAHQIGAFSLQSDEFGQGVPFGTSDGAAQGAYISGEPFAVVYREDYDLYFISTFHQTLGLEDFSWSDAKDEKGRDKSGPVRGSPQYVKCANLEEAQKAVKVVQEHFSDPANRPEPLRLRSFSGWKRLAATENTSESWSTDENGNLVHESSQVKTTYQRINAQGKVVPSRDSLPVLVTTDNREFLEALVRIERQELSLGGTLKEYYVLRQSGTMEDLWVEDRDPRVPADIDEVDVYRPRRSTGYTQANVWVETTDEQGRNQ